MSDQVVNVWSSAAASRQSPSVTVRYCHTAVLGACFVGVSTFAVLTFLSLLPALPHPVPGGYWLHVRAWPAVVLHALSLGHWFESFAGWYLDRVQQAGLGWPIGVRAAVSLGGAAWLGYIVLIAGLRPRHGVRHIEGPQLREGEEAEACARQQAAKLRGNDPGYMRLHPALDLPKTLWTRHMLIYGSVGSGKTQVLLPILQQIFEQNRKALIYDVKGDFTGYFPDGVLISPWDARSAVWDIGADVDTPSAAATFAASLIPEEQGNGKFFSLGAQQLLRGTVIAMQNAHGKCWGWLDLSEQLAIRADQWAALMLANLPKAATLVENPESVTVNSLLSTLAAYTTVIDDLATAWGNGKHREKISLRRWVRDNYRGKRQLIVQAGPDKKLTSAYIAAMINVLVPNIISPQLKDNERGRSLHFVLDEFSSIGRLNDFGSLVDKGRSKGVCCICCVQDIAQIEEIYGANLTKSLTGMVGTHVVCRVNMGETQGKIAELFGKRRVAVVNTSMSSGASGTGTNISLHEESRAVLSPSELESKLGPEQRKGGAFVVKAIVRIGGDPLLLEWPGLKLPQMRKPFMPAAWTKAKRKTTSAAPLAPLEVPVFEVDEQWADAEVPVEHQDVVEVETSGSTGGMGQDIHEPVAAVPAWHRFVVPLEDPVTREHQQEAQS